MHAEAPHRRDVVGHDSPRQVVPELQTVGQRQQDAATHRLVDGRGGVAEDVLDEFRLGAPAGERDDVEGGPGVGIEAGHASPDGVPHGGGDGLPAGGQDLGDVERVAPGVTVQGRDVDVRARLGGECPDGVDGQRWHVVRVDDAPAREVAEEHGERVCRVDVVGPVGDDHHRPDVGEADRQRAEQVE